MGQGCAKFSFVRRDAIVLAALLLFCTAAQAQIGRAWVRVKDDAGFPERLYHASVVFDGKIWLLGGSDQNFNYLNDIYSSTDGITWTLEKAAAEWEKRAGHQAVVYNGRIWVIGGQDDFGNPLSDVWWSDDGVNWTEATSAAAWAARFFHRAVVFNNRIYLLAGFDGTLSRRDVWWTTDGAMWNQATAAAAWTGRASSTAVVFNNRIYVMGGFNFLLDDFFSDVWYTENGTNWTRAVADAAWPGRDLHASVAYLNRLWVFGGYYDPQAVRDVWYSSDAVNWTRAIDAAEWPRRLGSTTVVHNNRLYIMGGANADVGTLDDVWYTSAGGSFRGRVTMAASAAPIECAAVLVRSQQTGYRRVAMADANGDWRLDDVAAGDYQITAYAPGFAQQTVQRSLAEGSYTYTNFSMNGVNADGGIRGTVTDEDTNDPVPGIRARAFINAQEVALVYTCSEGRYEMPALVSKLAEAKGGAMVTLQFDDDIDNGFDGAMDTVTVDPNDVTEANVKVAKSVAVPGSLAGTVSQAGAGVTIAGATVNIDGIANLTEFTDNGGAYFAAALPTGSYTVRASATGFEGKTQLVNVPSGIETLNFELETDDGTDVNGDGNTDAVDVQLVINTVLGVPTGVPADINLDGSEDAVDVQLVINGALGVK